MNEALVFLGPSLPVEQARGLFAARYLPPCKMGDVARCVDARPSTIVIIDGLFEQTAAVWHKEILFAMSQGISVIGGSSMGALRAAELHQFGMQGVGEIFRAFADGELEDDDEVAVSHCLAEAGFVSQTDAMVNIRHGLQGALLAEQVSPATCELLTRLSKALHYTKRCWSEVLELAHHQRVPPEQILALANYLARYQPNLKRDDAILVLQYAAAQHAQARPLSPSLPCRRLGSDAQAFSNWQFEPTRFWEQLLDQLKPSAA